MVKLAEPGHASSLLESELARVRWLDGRAGAPRLLAHGRAEDHAAVAFTAFPGLDATHPVHREDVVGLVQRLAGALRSIHALPVDDCPFDERLEARLADTQRRLSAGEVDQGSFDDLYRTYEPQALLDRARSCRPLDPEDLVVTHGDYSLPNVLLDHQGVTGVVDWGRAGVADRYVDLADVARSLVRNIGPEALGPFFDAYGLERPDLATLDFYVMLTQLA